MGNIFCAKTLTKKTIHSENSSTESAISVQKGGVESY